MDQKKNNFRVLGKCCDVSVVLIPELNYRPITATVSAEHTGATEPPIAKIYNITTSAGIYHAMDTIRGCDCMT